MRRKYILLQKQGKPTNFKDRYQAKSKASKKHQNKYIIDPVLFINPSKRRYQKSARSKEEQTSPLKIDHYKRFVQNNLQGIKKKREIMGKFL
ncbi:hypothetical protein HDV63DRAFT_3715 [Trichoderma sp. SZMC 28014]